MTSDREQKDVSPWNAAQKVAQKVAHFPPSWSARQSLDLFHMLIWENASRQFLERGGTFRKKLVGDWMLK